jgi:hypothetical protein
VDSVFTDGRFYKRLKDGSTWIYGDAETLRAFLLEIEFLSPSEISNRALQNSQFLTVQRASDAKRFEIALISPWPHPPEVLFCAAVTLENGFLAAICPEVKTGRNESKDQFQILSTTVSTSFIDTLTKLSRAG